MKKNLWFFSVLATLTVAGFVLADSVYDRSSMALSVHGSGTWTNTTKYSALKLAKLWVEQSANGANTATVMRITSSNAAAGDTYTHTQTCASITISSSNDNGQATLTAGYLAYGDKLSVTCTRTNAQNGIFVIEYETQKP